MPRSQEPMTCDVCDRAPCRLISRLLGRLGMVTACPDCWELFDDEIR
ncbi:MAG: hypothetical protein WD557_01070 [Dehalococcoidia bacterium]